MNTDSLALITMQVARRMAWNALDSLKTVPVADTPPTAWADGTGATVTLEVARHLYFEAGRRLALGRDLCPAGLFSTPDEDCVHWRVREDTTLVLVQLWDALILRGADSLGDYAEVCLGAK